MKRLMSMCIAAMLLAAMLSTFAVAEGGTEISCAQQNFTTRVSRACTAQWVDGSGEYVFFESPNAAPYMIIYNYGDLGMDGLQFIDSVIVPQITQACGSSLIETKRAENLVLGDVCTDGVLFVVESNGAQSGMLFMMMARDANLVCFCAEFDMDAQEWMMGAVEEAILHFEFGGSAPTAEPAAAPAAEPAAAPTAEPAVAPTAEPATVPAAEPAAEPAASGGGSVSEGSLRITPTEASQVTYESYADAYITMEIPKGWRVEIGLPDGTIDLISYAVKVYDPNVPERCAYLNLNNIAFKTEEGKAAYCLYDTSLQGLDVIPVQTTEGYFDAIGPKYHFTDFQPIENLGCSSVGGDVLHAACTADSGKALEGIFTAYVTANSYWIPANLMAPFGEQVDAGLVTTYSVLYAMAPQSEFHEWLPVLEHALDSLQFTADFQSERRALWQTIMQGQAYIAESNDAISGMISDSWNRRSASSDILSQKRSDATLGYERVYDVETGETYRAYNGFSDDYSGKRYVPAADDQYAQAVAGYIEK